MSDIVIVAIIVAIGSSSSAVIAPLVLSFYTNRQHQQDRAEDRADRDDVADQAAKAAELLLASNKKVADAAATTAASQGDTLNAIHTLVNSNLTTSMEAELAATEAALLMMKELGRPLAAIVITEARVTELHAALADRAKAQEKVNLEQPSLAAKVQQA